MAFAYVVTGSVFNEVGDFFSNFKSAIVKWEVKLSTRTENV